MFKKTVTVFLAVWAIANAVPILVQDEQGQLYHLETVESGPVLSRYRRQQPSIPGPNDPKLYGIYNGNSHQQGGKFSYQNPDGSGVDLGHFHANGFGHTVSLDGRVPIWSSKNPYGESTLNLGLGATQHFGGWAGDRNLDKRVGLTFNHRF